MAWVAQLAEHLIVVQVVVGSNPTPRPEHKAIIVLVSELA